MAEKWVKCSGHEPPLLSSEARYSRIYHERFAGLLQEHLICDFPPCWECLQASSLSLFSGLRRRCFCKTLLLREWPLPFWSSLGVLAGKPLFLVCGVRICYSCDFIKPLLWGSKATFFSQMHRVSNSAVCCGFCAASFLGCDVPSLCRQYRPHIGVPSVLPGLRAP